jgi:16S rRNA (adenine1518-N6/adenine1519-N6)-dimethyltransferase
MALPNQLFRQRANHFRYSARFRVRNTLRRGKNDMHRHHPFVLVDRFRMMRRKDSSQVRSLPVRYAASNRGSSRHKPKLGQNFLVSPSAPRAIVEALGDLSQATVLEIGPGGGVLTQLLAPRAKHLIAVELDRSIVAALQRESMNWAGSPIEIVCQDILTLDLTELASRRGVRLQVIGNLPYYISSPILTHLFAHSAVIDRAVLMAQREVAERIVAPPGTSAYGLLSATTQMYAGVENLFTLPPEAFAPPPKVHSTVFRLSMNPRFEELQVDAAGFVRFLRQAFTLKRKTLGNNLRASGYSPAAVDGALTQCAVNTQTRAEAVSLDEMACLFRALSGEGSWSRVPS